MPDDPAPTQEPQQPEPSRAEKRIAQLYGQKKEAEEKAALLETQTEELRTQLVNVQEQLKSLSERQQTPQLDVFGNHKVEHKSGDDLKALVAAAVKETVGPAIQELERAHLTQQLHAAQNQSFQQAALEFPDLGDAESDLFRTAQKIVKADPSLVRDPQGPYKAALFAAGVLASSGGPGQDRKAAAAAPAGGVPTGPANEPSELTKLEKELDEVNAQMSKSTDPVQAWRRRIDIQNRIAAVRTEVAKRG